MDTQVTLDQAFNYTADDLEANRSGQLSPVQMSRLRSQAMRTMLIIVSVIVVLGFMAALTAHPTSGDIVIFLVVLILPALAAFAFTVGTTESAISPRVVSKRTGQVYLFKSDKGFEPPLSQAQALQMVGTGMRAMGLYGLFIDGMFFRLSAEEYAVLVAGATYTLYFIPNMHRIMSVERTTPEEKFVLPPQPAELPPPTTTTRTDDDSGDVIRA